MQLLPSFLLLLPTFPVIVVPRESLLYPQYNSKKAEKDSPARHSGDSSGSEALAASEPVEDAPIVKSAIIQGTNTEEEDYHNYSFTDDENDTSAGLHISYDSEVAQTLEHDLSHGVDDGDLKALPGWRHQKRDDSNRSSSEKKKRTKKKRRTIKRERNQQRISRNSNLSHEKDLTSGRDYFLDDESSEHDKESRSSHSSIPGTRDIWGIGERQRLQIPGFWEEDTEEDTEEMEEPGKTRSNKASENGFDKENIAVEDSELEEETDKAELNKLLNLIRITSLDGDTVTDVREAPEVISDDFEIEVDEGDEFETIGFRDPKQMSRCNFAARLSSDPDSLVSISGCSMDDLTANVVSDLKGHLAGRTLRLDTKAFNVFRNTKLGKMKPVLTGPKEASIRLERDTLKPPKSERIGRSGKRPFRKPNIVQRSLFKSGSDRKDSSITPEKLAPSPDWIVDRITVYIRDNEQNISRTEKPLLVLKTRENAVSPKNFSMAALRMNPTADLNLAVKYLARQTTDTDLEQKEKATQKGPSKSFRQLESRIDGDAIGSSLLEGQDEHEIKLFVMADAQLYQEMKDHFPRLKGTRLLKKIGGIMARITQAASNYLSHKSFGLDVKVNLSKLRLLAEDSGIQRPEMLDVLERFHDYLRSRKANHSFPQQENPGEMTAQTFPNNGGVSYVGTVCENPVYANAVMSFKWSDEVQKEGETKFQLSSMARVMAHEIAHLLHTRHDGDRNECNPGVSARRLMTPVISPEASVWSKCTRESIQKSKAKGYLDCLKKKKQ